MGRPRKNTDEQIIAALEAAKGAVYRAAERLGCEADTIYYRAKLSKRIAATLRSERGTVVDVAESKLYTAVLAGESWAILFTLRTLGKDRGYCTSRAAGYAGTPNVVMGEGRRPDVTALAFVDLTCVVGGKLRRSFRCEPGALQALRRDLPLLGRQNPFLPQLPDAGDGREVLRIEQHDLPVFGVLVDRGAGNGLDDALGRDGAPRAGDQQLAAVSGHVPGPSGHE